MTVEEIILINYMYLTFMSFSANAFQLSAFLFIYTGYLTLQSFEINHMYIYIYIYRYFICNTDQKFVNEFNN